jgi:hypothetical protein
MEKQDLQNKQSFAPQLENNSQWDKIKGGKKWQTMQDTVKASDGAVHLKNFKKVEEREQDLVTRMYAGQLCHSVKQ